MAIKRSQKLIDKKFQLSTTFKILGILLISFLIIIAILSISAMKNSKNLAKTINDLNQVMVTEENIIKAFIDYSKMIENSGLILHTKKITEDHGDSMDKIKNHVNQLNISINRNFQLIVIIIGIIIVIAVCLYFYILNITHRVSGPIYVMTRHIEEMLEGNTPQFRKLRDKDELKEFYQKFIEITEKFYK